MNNSDAIPDAINDAILRWPRVKSVTTLSRTQAWRAEKAKQFPARRKIGLRSVGWLQSEIAAWIASREVVGRAK